jgi:zinc/manganese transport system permease protein
MTSIDPVIIEFLKAPACAALIIGGIHAYLGLHVVERGVIFVDLSLAQIASLGATLAISGLAIGNVTLIPILADDPHGAAVYWMGLAFTLVGALIFSMIKGHEARIPQEAIVGISYAVASAAVILALSKSTGESEHLRDMLVGNILSVQWGDVRKTGLTYLVIGAFHYVFRKAFLRISSDPTAAAAAGMRVRFWDFLFYASFGLVVTSSVAIAGVLLVFCYLIVPSVGGMLWAERIGSRLAVGWGMSAVVSILGMYFSVLFDLPTGATIVCTFGLVLVLMALVRPVLVRKPAVAASGGRQRPVTAHPPRATNISGEA